MQSQIRLENMQNRLLERKKVITKQIATENEKILPKTTANQDNADLAYDYEYRSHQASRIDQLEYQLTEVDKALKRIEKGVYGICTKCGASILPERLEALPQAGLCIDCQRKAPR